MARMLAWAAAAVLAAGQWMIWEYAPVETTMGLVQKVFYVHMPLAWWSMVSFGVVFVASAGYLWKRGRGMDALAAAAAEIGVMFSGLALVTGMVWGRAAWGVWWTWDPRLTTTLVMWFVYAGYLVLRHAPMAEERRGLACAVLGVAAFVDVPLVFLSARLWRSVHPAVLAAKGGGLEPEMWATVLVNVGAFGLLWLALLLVRCNLVRAEERIEARLVFAEE